MKIKLTYLTVFVSFAFYIITLMALNSCSNTTTAIEKPQTEQEKNTLSITKNEYYISGADCVRTIYIDSCEYVVVGVGYSQMMSHKGDCKHCKNIHAIENKEMVLSLFDKIKTFIITK